MATESDKFTVGYLGSSEFGGWLLFLIIILWSDAVLYLFVGFVARHSYVPALWNLFLSALTASAAYFLTIKNSKGVLLAKLYFAANLVLRLVGVARIGTASIFRTSASIGITTCYYLYLVRSERVKAIYFSGASKR